MDWKTQHIKDVTSLQNVIEIVNTFPSNPGQDLFFSDIDNLIHKLHPKGNIF